VRRQDEVCHPAGYTIPYEELIQQGKNKASLVVDLPWRVLRGEPEALIVEQNIVASYSRDLLMASYLCRLRITASVLFFLVIRYIGMNGASAASAPSSKDAARLDGNQVIQVVFSDVDGTLVHYPEHMPAQDPAILALPPSSTGLRAVISQETLRKCQEIRQSGRKLVLVSGMRTTTLLHRLPFLPRADAYCSEAGGRIFYPTSNTNEIKIEPLPYKGATAESLSSFGLEEDLEWRKIMEEAAGSDGFEGQDLASMASGTAQMIPASQRKGPLWEFARKLESLGLVLDTKGYATSFRVTARQQPASSMKSKEAFQDLLQQNILFPPEVATRTNLGSVDFYPVSSGKKHW
jgi:hypothetical protein